MVTFSVSAVSACGREREEKKRGGAIWTSLFPSQNRRQRRYGIQLLEIPTKTSLASDGARGDRPETAETPMGDSIEFPGPATDIAHARTTPGARRAYGLQPDAPCARHRKAQVSAVLAPWAHSNYDYSHTNCHKGTFMAVGGCGVGLPSASSPRASSPCSLPRLVSSHLLRASAARSRPMSLQVRQRRPVKDRPSWNFSGFLRETLSHSVTRPALLASSGHGEPGQGGDLFGKPPGPGGTGDMRAKDRGPIRGHVTSGYVPVLPSAIRVVCPYSRFLRAFRACLTVPGCGILAVATTLNQVDEVHTRQALLTSSLSRRRRSPESTWGCRQQSGVTGVESRRVSVCPEVAREQGS